MTFTADTAPVDALAGSLAGAADQLRDPGALVAGVAADVAQLAGPRTPRRTGRLAGSVTVAADTDTAAVRWGVGYAVFVNFGTRRMTARPFATDALAAAERPAADATTAWAAGIMEGI